MLDISGIPVSLDAMLPENEAKRKAEVARALGCKPADFAVCTLLRRSVDARKKANVHFTTTFRVSLAAKAEKRLLEKAPRGCTVRPAKVYAPLEYPQLAAPEVSPLVVGAGPAGLFAALYLARCGLCPVVVERGQCVQERAASVARFQETGVLDSNSNIQFGEGGAGTFSDGKLTTNIKNRLAPHVLQLFVEAGAPEDILVEAHPHLGSDNLPGIVTALRTEIIRHGGTVLFGTRLVGWQMEAGRLAQVSLEDTATGAMRTVSANVLVLACGHSACDVFQLASDSGLAMEQKPFSVGVRVEHAQKAINRAQWGSAAEHPALGAAEYKMAVHLPSGRSVYTFCMCPGGEVVAAASEEGGIVTNGMSCYARAGANANSALLVNVDPTDFGADDALAGVRLQQRIEHAAYQTSLAHGGAPYQAPCQRVGDFLASASEVPVSSGKKEFLAADEAVDLRVESGMPSGAQGQGRRAFDLNPVQPTYARGVVEAPLRECLPAFVADALAEALPLMGRKLKGFDSPDALLTAPETRSSSPVRIRRAKNFQAFFAEGETALCPMDEEASASTSSQNTVPENPETGIYPCGEGPGYAGGIMSAACDGLRVAQAVAARYAAALSS